MGSNGSGIIGGFFAIVLVIVGLFACVALGAWVFSFHGVDPGHVAVVKEGGPFDGRNLKEVRQPGSGAAAIGAFNHQYNLPTTQRDLTEEAGNITVPTADGVNVNVDGQALFQLIVDGNDDTSKNKDIKFFQNFGLRSWNGKHLYDDDGWVEFLKIRMVPILYQSVRQTIGTYDCTELNNTCVYVLNANVLADTAGGTDKASQQAKSVNTEQNLAEAEQKITDAFVANLKAGLGDEYFEHIRFQNLRVTFPADIQEKVQEAQAKRAEVATAKLEAQRKVQEAEGNTQVAAQDAKQIELRGKVYQRSPEQAQIDKIKAFCGPDGCDPQAVGGNFLNQLTK